MGWGKFFLSGSKSSDKANLNKTSSTNFSFFGYPKINTLETERLISENEYGVLRKINPFKYVCPHALINWSFINGEQVIDEKVCDCGKKYREFYKKNQYIPYRISTQDPSMKYNDKFWGSLYLGFKRTLNTLKNAVLMGFLIGAVTYSVGFITSYLPVIGPMINSASAHEFWIQVSRSLGLCTALIAGYYTYNDRGPVEVNWSLINQDITNLYLENKEEEKEDIKDLIDKIKLPESQKD